MEAVYSALLVVGAFWLGACPFSVWIGRWLLDKDIRDYGDGNPGAANVFRAGSRKAGSLALALDMAKGVPFVVLARSFFELPDLVVMAVGLSAILGHAFSPLLRLRGGKAVGVTFGVLLAFLPQSHMLITFAVFMFLGFLFIEVDAWIVMFGAVGSLAYLAITRGSSWELLFMLCALAILAVKHFDDLHSVPRLGGRLIHWLQSRRRET
jgi:glycerol-3-phosphate acyltransferase PlsY